MATNHRHPVILLNEFCNREHTKLIDKYTFVGPDNDRIFTCILTLESIQSNLFNQIGKGEGKTKKEAKFNAANDLLPKLPSCNKTGESPPPDVSLMKHETSLTESVTAMTLTGRGASPMPSSNTPNYKGMLQEFCQKRDIPKPKYEQLSKEGPDHQLKFTVKCIVVNRRSQLLKEGLGRGHSSKTAQANAAAEVYKFLTSKNVELLPIRDSTICDAESVSTSSSSTVTDREFVETIDQGGPISNQSTTVQISTDNAINQANQIGTIPTTTFSGSVKTIGNISFDEKQVIGIGAYGTMVFKGALERGGRKVAVKRIYYQEDKAFIEEVHKLIDCDNHDNIVQYFHYEYDEVFVYIALQLCITSLRKYIEDPNVRRHLHELMIDEKMILQDAMKGLRHLHSATLKIVHRDIKPDNILLTQKSSKEVKAVLCDFGISTQIEEGRVSVTTGSARGTFGWKAPELCHKSNDRKKTCTTAVDIFAMGCVIYYVLSSGGHPFGKTEMEAHVNIESESKDEEREEYRQAYPLIELSDEVLERKAAEHLVKLMIAKKREKRPSAEVVLKHCYFWSKHKQLEFIQGVNDWLVAKKDSDVDTAQSNIETDALEVIKDNWKSYIDPKLLQELESEMTESKKGASKNSEPKKPKYNGTSLCELIRAIRNKKNHYQSLSTDLHQMFGSLPDGYMTYFLTQFPSIIIHTYTKMVVYKQKLDPYMNFY